MAIILDEIKILGVLTCRMSNLDMEGSLRDCQAKVEFLKG